MNFLAFDPGQVSPSSFLQRAAVVILFSKKSCKKLNPFFGLPSIYVDISGGYYKE
jgi:hypothetical protein